MSNFSWISDYVSTVLIVLAAVLLLSSYVPRWWMSLKYRRLPPGPFCWPLVGYLPGLSKQAIEDCLREVSHKYRGIFGFYAGSRYVVFIDDFQALKEAFSRQEFLGRPDGIFSISPDQHKTSLADENDVKWKEMKRFWQSSTRLLVVNSQVFRSTMAREIHLLTEELGRKDGLDVDVHQVLEHSLFNLGFFIAFGKTFDRGNRILELVHEYNHATVTFLTFNVVKFIFPWLGIILSLLPKHVTTRKSIDRLENVLSEEVRKHEQTLDPNDPRDFVDLFLLQMQKPGTDKNIFNEGTLLANSMVVILGYTVSICTGLEWFLLNMAAHPEAQTNIQSKIDSEIGREREPLVSDRPLLPLLDAAIMESMRIKYLEAVGGFRSVLRDTTLKGHDIPKESLVFYNVDIIFRSSKYWTEPDRFDPNRFLSEDGSSLRVPEHFIPYGTGKRISLGEGTSGPITFLFAACLLQRFRILPPDGGICMDSNGGVLNRPASPFVKFQRRL